MRTETLCAKILPAFHRFLSASLESGETDGGGMELFIRYIGYSVVVAAGALLLALVKRKERKNLTPDALRQRCGALKRKLEETLSAEEKGANGMWAQARSVKLRSAAEEALWCALRLVDERKDLIFDGIANELDGIADILAEVPESAFGEKKEAEEIVRAALERTNGVIAKIDEIITARKSG